MESEDAADGDNGNQKRIDRMESRHGMLRGVAGDAFLRIFFWKRE